MACEILVFGQELVRLVRRLNIPNARTLEGLLSSHTAFSRPIAAVVLDTQTLPLGSKAFERLRRRVVPLVAIVSSYDEAEVALRAGCRDVLVNPVAAEDLKLRIQGVLRLPEMQSISVGTLVIDARSRRVTRGAVEIRLRPQEYNLLHYLAANAGRVVPYDELLNEVWGYDYDNGSYLAIRATIKRLRQQIEPVPSSPRHILNVAKVGYVLVAEG